MAEQFDNVVANGVATTEKKKYVKPEIEVIPIEVQAPLLAASYTPNGFGFEDNLPTTYPANFQCQSAKAPRPSAR